MGYQTPGTSAHKTRKDHPVQSSVRLEANVQKPLPENRTIVGLPANVTEDIINSRPPGFGQGTNFHGDLPAVSDT